MITQDDTDAILYRTAIVAINYYPTKPVEEPGYTIDEDVAWCLEPLGADAAARASLVEVVRDVIEDPTAHRQRLCDVLDMLTDDS